MDKRQNISQTQITEPIEPSSFSLISALGIAGFLSGIILVSTFIYTNPMIKANKEAAIQRAIFKVLPECETYVPLEMIQGDLKEKTEKADDEEGSDQEELLIYAGYNARQELIGFAIPGSEPGFQDVITAMFGYDDSRKVIIGFDVLESKETPGLGDKIFKDADFQVNFKSLVVEPEIVPVKKGEKKQSNEVEAITGATISSKAIVRLLNNAMKTWEGNIDEYVKNNKLRISEKDE